MKTLTDMQRAEIDSLILAGKILLAIDQIRTACGISLRDAADLNRERYRQLRGERPEAFHCTDEEYWSGYSECIFDAMARDL